MTSRHVLILGGTGDARLLAARLARRGDLRITLSLAGRTQAPLAQAGEVRSGGFGGAEGLAAWLRESRVDALVDATHPFATRMSQNAVQAARMTGVPLVVLSRPQWEPVEGDRWIDAGDVAEAAELLGPGRRTVFLAIGRQELAAFAAQPQHRYVVRSVDAVDDALRLADAHYILDRGPFAEPDERMLFEREGIEVVVAKNSGGDATYGKIAAARSLNLPVIVVRRPHSDTGQAVLADVDAVIARVAHVLGLPAERGE